MARRYFPGWSVERLEQKLDQVLEDLASGKVTTSWSAGDTSTGKQIVRSLEQVRSELLNDLSILAPDQYPAADFKRVTVTIGRIRDQ